MNLECEYRNHERERHRHEVNKAELVRCQSVRIERQKDETDNLGGKTAQSQDQRVLKEFATLAHRCAPCAFHS